MSQGEFREYLSLTVSWFGLSYKGLPERLADHLFLFKGNADMELTLDNVATLALNTQAFGVKQNLQRINQAVQQALEQGKNALFCSELCVSGMECNDLFFSSAFIAKVQEQVKEFQSSLPLDFVVGLGMPKIMTASCFANEEAFNAAIAYDDEEQKEQAALYGLENGPLASAYVLLTRDEVVFTAPSKLKLEHSRLDYSVRYFYQAYEFPGFDLIQGYVAQVGEQKILIAFGDSQLFISPDLQDYIAQHHDEFAFIVVPEAYGYEVELPQRYEQEALALAATYNLPLIRVNNLGCEGGSTIYDGQCIFIKDNEVIARNPLFSFRPYEIVTAKSGVEPALAEYDEMLKAVALGMYDWMKKTHSKGFALSLSGGADSALCATVVALSQIHALRHLGAQEYVQELKELNIKFDYDAFLEEVISLGGMGPYSSATSNLLMEKMIEVLKKYVIPQVLVCAYQGSDYSGQVTRVAATKMSECLGATFYEWSISNVVSDYLSNINKALGYELSWSSDDIALQNIQARSRLPGIWLLANHKGFLLIATSNLSEAAVGYCTMDGDTAGGLSPIAGIGKSTILKMNRAIMHDGIGLDGFEQRFKVPAMSYIVAQAPTAELRPGGEQTDEKDLMPYPLLDTIRRLFAQEDMLPDQIEHALIAGKEDDFKSVTVDLGLSDEDIMRSVKRFFNLFQRNQWKRERFATAFHIEKDDSSPKGYLRLPVLSASLCD